MPETAVPAAAVALTLARESEPGRATAMVTVSPLVWLVQSHATPFAATAVAAAVPPAGLKLASSPKLALKLYMVWAETSVPQPIVTAWAGVPAVGVGLGEAGVVDPTGVGESEELAPGEELDPEVFGVPTHPVRPMAAMAAALASVTSL